jgi:diaminopimelate epimerase
MTKLSVIDCELWSRQIWVGNPQCAVEIDRDPSTFALHRYGPPLVDHPQFADRTNVSIWQRVCAHHIRARTFERGVGETLSSGTGAAGAAVASVLAGGASPVTVHLPGGTLEVSVDTELAVTVSVRPVPLFAGTTHSALPLCGGTADVRTAR